MKAERQQKEPQQTEPIQSKRGRSKLSFVDKRPRTGSQARLIQSIQKKENKTDISNDIKTGTIQLKLVPLSENRMYVDDVTKKEYYYLSQSIMYPINGMHRFRDLETGYEVQFHESYIQFRGVSSVHSSFFAKYPLEQEQLRTEGRVELITKAGPTLTRLTPRDVQTTSKMTDFDGAKVGTKYTDIFKSLRVSIADDSVLAAKLLDQIYTEEDSKEFLRAAAMLESIVGLSEWYRDPSAPRLFRAALRLIEEGKGEFKNLPQLFKFIISAQRGREQATQIERYEIDHSPPSPTTASLIPYLSPKPK